jgi:murein DD-endopeptidase MepM/ murein hydrolase activator NlpD
MSSIAVAAGQRVRKGDVVGTVGSTGVATGPHLHWGLRINGLYVDPLRWVSPAP